jgi:hypothetical protein
MPGSGASITTQRGHALGILRGKRVAHHVANVVRYEIGLLDFQPVEDVRNVRGLRFLVVATFGMRRQTHALQVGGDDRMVFRQQRSERRPHIAGIAESVQHHHGRPLPAGARVDRRAVRRDLPGLKGWRKWQHWHY